MCFIIGATGLIMEPKLAIALALALDKDCASALAGVQCSES